MHRESTVTSDGARTAATRSRRAATVPALEARPGTPASRAASVLGGRPPLLVYGAMLVLGYLVTWFAAHRTGSRNQLSEIGSKIGDVPTLPVLVALVVLLAVALRRWRVQGFVLGAILVEVGTYRVASLIVHRHRPDVVRLDRLPVEQSFPSGHSAAAVAVYEGLAIVASSLAHRRVVTVVAWTLACALVAVVVTSRLYRGMHHPLDVTSGVIVGILSIVVALLATRAADASARGVADRKELA